MRNLKQLLFDPFGGEENIAPKLQNQVLNKFYKIFEGKGLLGFFRDPVFTKEEVKAKVLHYFKINDEEAKKLLPEVLEETYVVGAREEVNFEPILTRKGEIKYQINLRNYSVFP